MAYLYPRFTPSAAEKMLRALEKRIASGQGARITLKPDSMPETSWPATGGVPVDADRLRTLRGKVESAVQGQECADHQSRRVFDIEVGLTLFKWLEQDGPTNAADQDMWSFLTIAVMPDLALRRFPSDPGSGRLPRERFLAGRRNVFYRAYLRALVLGELLRHPDMELYEDELVGMIDRNLSMDHRLTRAIAREIAGLPRSGNRRETVRNGLKAIQYEVKVTDLGYLSEAGLQEVVHLAMHQGV